jgi:23S rRNA (cytosine1962-C5)-methyltransferase
MVQWGKENAVSTGVQDRSVRWIVDDCMKFVAREIRRGNKYDIIIMDPPSYGRGPGGEVWKLENEIYGFVNQCKELLTDDSLAVLINSYTAGVSPAVMSYILNTTVAKRFGGKAYADEIGLPVTETGLVLPCGSTAVWTK